MRYALLIYTDEAFDAQRSPEENEALMGAYYAFTNEVRENDVFVSGEALQTSDTAATVRVKDGRTVTTNSTAVETKEQLGGFYILECKDLDEAVAYAAKIPAAQAGSVEIRPIMDMG